MKRLVLLALSTGLLLSGCGSSGGSGSPAASTERIGHAVEAPIGAFLRYSTVPARAEKGTYNIYITDKVAVPAVADAPLMKPVVGETVTLRYYAYDNGKPGSIRGYLFFPGVSVMWCDLDLTLAYDRL